MQVEILQVSVETITFTFAPCTVEHNDKSNDTCCDILNEQSCHTDVIKELDKSNKNEAEKSKDGSGSIFNHWDSPELALFPYRDALNEAVCHTDVKKELYKSKKNAEKPNEDGSDSICRYVDRGKLALVPYKESLSALQNADCSNWSIKHPIERNSESMELRKRSKCEKMESGNDIAHKQNFDTNKAIYKIDLKDEKYFKRQEKKNRRERITPVVDLQPEDKNKDNQNLDKSQVKDVIHLGETPKSTKESLLRIYSRKMCSSVSNFSDGKWFKFACLFTVVFSARVFCINENAGMDIQFPANPILFGTDVVLSCYRPFSENMKHVSYFAWRNQLTAEYLAIGNRSMNVSRYEPAVIHTESGINYTFRINSFDHDDFNECNIGFLKGHVNISACNTTFIYLPKNEDITSHNVRKGGQETMVIEMKRVHPNPVCKLFIQNKMISDRLYNATVGTVLIYNSLRYVFPRDNLVQYCHHVLEITCSVSGEHIHYYQTINFSSWREITQKSDNHDNTVDVIVTVTISISILLATFCIVIYKIQKRGKMCSSVSNFSDGKWFKFACLFTVVFSARVFCINENAGMDIQFPANPILFGTDVVLSCYRPFSENMTNVSYFAWRNQLTADYLTNGDQSMNVSKYESVVIHTESGINYTLRINSFDHDDFNMLYECNIGFLKGHVNISACNTTFIYLPKNEDITSHNVRKGGQETMVIEMKRVHPYPVCKLFIKNKMISYRLYNATVGTVLIYYSLRFEFPRDNLVQYCYRVLEITCSVSGEQIHHNQTIHFTSCRENAKKSDNHDYAAAVIVTVTISIAVVLATFCIVLVYLKRKRLGQLTKNSNGPGEKREEESATCKHELLIIHEDDNG